MENLIQESRQEKLARINGTLDNEGLPQLRKLGLYNKGRGGEWEVVDLIGVFTIFHALKIGIYIVKHPLTGTITKHVVEYNLLPGHTVLVVVNGEMIVSLQTNRFALQSVILEFVRGWEEVDTELPKDAVGRSIVVKKLPELLKVAKFDVALPMTVPLIENSGISDQRMQDHVVFLISEYTDASILQSKLRKHREDKTCIVFVKTIAEVDEIVSSHILNPGSKKPEKNKGFQDVFSLGTWLVFLKYFLEPYNRGDLTSGSR